jgi:hypothetical protein
MVPLGAFLMNVDPVDGSGSAGLQFSISPVLHADYQRQNKMMFCMDVKEARQGSTWSRSRVCHDAAIGPATHPSRVDRANPCRQLTRLPNLQGAYFSSRALQLLSTTPSFAISTRERLLLLSFGIARILS